MSYAVITGSSSGIGAEFARLFARDGYDLVLVARSEDKLVALAEELVQEYDVDCKVVVLDLSLREAPAQLVSYLQERQIDTKYLINNAGFGDFGMFIDAKWSKLDSMMQLNMRALTALCYLIAPYMVQQGSGKILNVASTAAFQPGPLMAVYYATKSYVLSFSQALANELEGTGVTVTTLCPGPTKSEFQETAQMSKSKIVVGKKLPTALELAEYGYEQLNAGAGVVVHGWRNRVMVFFSKLLPTSFVVRIVRQISEEETDS